MKKYILFLSLFALIFGFGLFINTSSASAWDSGCSAAGPYSRTTGQACGKSIECAPGDLYSFIDGHACTNSTLPPGCYTSTQNYSVTTGLSCISGTTIVPITLAPTVTVLSPNGGEIWIKGTTQMIKWQDLTLTTICSTGATNCYTASVAPKYYDIKLVFSSPVCVGQQACLPYQIMPYTIASDVSGSSYNWTVGTVMGSTNAIASNGSYTIQVCQTGTTDCDSSDAPFTISSEMVSQGSVISGVSGVIASSPSISSLSPTSGNVGTSVTIIGSGFTATGNKIKFGNLGSENNSNYSLKSSDGKTLVFTVPTGNYYACWNSTPACSIAVTKTQSGTYAVSVINANGTSNAVNFMVAGLSINN